MTTGIVRRLKRQNPNLQILVKEPFNKTRQYRDIFYKNPFIVNADTINEKYPHIKIPRVLAGINDESSSGGVDSQAISKGRAQQATISRAGDVA